MQLDEKKYQALLLDPRMGETERQLLKAFHDYAPQEYTVTVDGEPLRITAYEGLFYVTRPVKVDTERTMGMGRSNDPYAWNKLSIWIPENAGKDSAILLHAGNGGWHNTALKTFDPAALTEEHHGPGPRKLPLVMPGGSYSSTDPEGNIGQALKRGYAVVDCGARGRLMVDAQGKYAGKTPAVLVDIKAVIRYLRLMDPLIPPSAERIVITGTSGGGALSSIIAASGNAPEYYPYLREVGAAGFDSDGHPFLGDDIFGVIAYCPIIDVGHADMAYAWQYLQTRLHQNEKAPGTWSEETISASRELAARFPAYVESLGLRLEDGTPLTCDNLNQAAAEWLKKSAAFRPAGTTEVPPFGEMFKLESPARDGTQNMIVSYHKNDWLRLDPETGEVTDFYYQPFLDFVADTKRLKDDPAFDESGYRRISGPPHAMWDPGESNLFGDADTEYSLFTEYTWDHADRAIPGMGRKNTGLSWQQFLETEAGKLVRMQIRTVSPFSYLNHTDCQSAPYWYVRHGMRDRDTAFALETMLYYALLHEKDVAEVNFRFAWLYHHTGNYDAPEAYAWLAEELEKAGPVSKG